ncbi:MAG TPA: hypothetical protein VHO01_05690 [Jatrophihabitans sp.]|nr:hypothetical protein [Jatrophihabitans sp.]
MKKLLVSSAALIACAVPAIATAAPAIAATPSAAPAYSCVFDRIGTVNANLLKVHTSPDGSTVIGDFPGGQSVEFCGSSGTAKGGYTWVWAAGRLTNGASAKGWIAENYLTNIRRIA